MLDRKYIVPVVDSDQFIYGDTDINNPKECLERINEILDNTEMINQELEKLLFMTCTKENKEYYKMVSILYDIGRKSLFNDESNDILLKIFEFVLSISNFRDKWILKLKINDIFVTNKIKVLVPQNYINIVFSEDCKNIVSLAKEYLEKEIGKNITRTKIAAFCVICSIELDDQAIIELEMLDENIFYFIAYVFSNSKTKYEILLSWLKNLKIEEIELNLLYLENIDSMKFIINELNNIKDNNVFVSIIKHSKSHKLIDVFFSRLYESKYLLEILLITYKDEDHEYTNSIFSKIFAIDNNEGEKMLKRFLIETKSKYFSAMFFEKCKNVDSYYIEACLICSNNIDLIRDENIIKVSQSHYFSFLTSEYVIYEKCLRKLKKIFDEDKFEIYDTVKDKKYFIKNLCKRLFKEQIIIEAVSIKKILLFLELFPESYSEIFKYLIEVLIREKQFVKNNKLENIEINRSTNTLAENNTHKIITSQENIIICGFNTNDKNLLFTLIDKLRHDNRIINYIDILLGIDYEIYLENVVFNDSNILDLLFIESINYFISNMVEFDCKKKLIKKIIKYKHLSCRETYYWNIILRKNINTFELFDDSVLMDKLMAESIGKNLQEIDKNEMYFYNSNSNIISILINDIKNNHPKYRNYKLYDKILKKFQLENSYPEGLVFFDSSIIIERRMVSFCCYIIYFQTDVEAEQNLISLYGNLITTIGLKNARLFRKIQNGKQEETILLDQGNNHSKKINLSLSYNSGILLLYINEIKYKFYITDINKLIIGKNFKGIVSKILWYEYYGFKMEYTIDIPRSRYFIDFLSDLEKILIFNNHAGVYIDTLTPYFLSSCPIDIYISNIYKNSNFYWKQNTDLKNILLEESIKDQTIKSLYEKYFTE
ncbi:hypothetical protein CWI39_0826p0010 [Hamiltosporidium magnivora]|uniref:Uncharacterized protein n=1 Tax=Hamiltosporidium magnivora TaxID=148818 RepID=A0A4Q9LB97_9MICR|nr:hypothetical protein CWI39_0826p0010 [Hamiltosporidium magnivora]